MGVKFLNLGPALIPPEANAVLFQNTRKNISIYCPKINTFENISDLNNNESN